MGITGARLYYPDNTVQHAGIVIGIDGIHHLHWLSARKDASSVNLPLSLHGAKLAVILKSSSLAAVIFHNDHFIMHPGRLLQRLHTAPQRVRVIGIDGIAANMFPGLRRGQEGYYHKAAIQLNYSAVTAACLMVSKEIYQQVGGLEEKLAVAFNDVDFCLRE